ncbi:MAG: hypothetical protein IMZ53_01100 [Thermoplasmata archaeon]|nr:hypothetical protein [Thermoplasmata archaeon]
MVDISKEDLKKAFEKIGQQNRLFTKDERRYILCEEVWGDDGTEYDCDSDTNTNKGIDELYKALLENKKSCDRK